MLGNVIEKVTSRLVIVLLLAAVTASTSTLSYKFNGYTRSMEVATKAITTLSVKVEAMSEIIGEARQARFIRRLIFLSKQIYKMDKAPMDIRPMDIESSSDFCGSDLFDEYKDSLKGSEKIKVTRACSRVDSWAIEQDA